MNRTYVVLFLSLSVLTVSTSCDDGGGDPVDADQGDGDIDDAGPDDSGSDAADSGSDSDGSCVPDCEGRCCGSDGCDGECTESCDDTERCDLETCACIDLSACGAANSHPECSSVSPAPEESEEIEAFVALNAISLKCLDGEDEEWNFSIFESDMEEMSIFMFGEVHGSRELGNISADLFEHLVRQGLINALALEFVMDATEAMNTYIQTGEGDLVSVYQFQMFAPNDFLRLLIERARTLYEEGYEITGFAVDFPWDLREMNDQIAAIASDLSEEQSALVLDTMPTAPAGLAPRVTADFVRSAEDYHQHLVDNSSTICAELSDGECERLEMLARALWVGAFVASGLMSSATDAEFIEFLTTREELIYFNYRSHMTTGDERVYSHMGRAHTLKGSSGYGFDVTAGRLDSEYPVTQGRVYTTSYDNGPGSEVLYHGAMEPVFPTIEVISDALTEALFDTYAVSTFQPGYGCVGNPLAELGIPASTEMVGDAYDAIVFVRQLTADAPGGGDKSAIPGTSYEVQHAIDCLETVRTVERRFMGRRNSQEDRPCIRLQ